METETVWDRTFIETAYWPIALLLVLLLVLLWFLGYRPSGKHCTACASSTPSSTLIAPPNAVVVPAATPVAAAPPLPTAARLYFASNSDALRSDTAATLHDVLAYLRRVPGARARISGFHDPTGELSYNQALAHRRAAAVSAALQKAGVDASRIELIKPQVTAPGGRHAEARRVEVSVQAR